MTDRVAGVLRALDERNARDPRRTPSELGGKPLELDHAERMTRWITALRPDASDALRIAARGQHLERWTVPRDRYPAGRGGYLRWREELKKFHAASVAGVMSSGGCDAGMIDRVRSLILKKDLKTDPEAQTLEDALCLVFLETQFADLRARTPDDKMKEIVRKTWAKMGEGGRRAALGLPLPDAHRSLLKEALAG